MKVPKSIGEQGENLLVECFNDIFAGRCNISTDWKIGRDSSCALVPKGKIDTMRGVTITSVIYRVFAKVFLKYIN
jgi:hypothetical protein